MSADDGDDSEYDDDDVAGAACGLRASGDGKFDIGLVFRMMDRDKDGVVSIRDWGVATGSGPGLGARMTGKQVRQRVRCSSFATSWWEARAFPISERIDLGEVLPFVCLLVCAVCVACVCTCNCQALHKMWVVMIPPCCVLRIFVFSTAHLLRLRRTPRTQTMWRCRSS